MWNEKNKYITVHFRFAICCQGLSETEAVLEAAVKVIEDSKCKTILELKFIYSEKAKQWLGLDLVRLG